MKKNHPVSLLAPRSSASACLLTLSVGTFFLATAPAQAGFDWTPPPQPAPQQQIFMPPLTPDVPAVADLDENTASTPAAQMPPPIAPTALQGESVEQSAPVLSQEIQPMPLEEQAPARRIISAPEETPASLETIPPRTVHKQSASTAPISHENKTEIVATPEIESPAPMAPVTTVETSPSKTAEAKTEALPSDMIAGFGRDIPLVLALRQIVPPSYAFAFAPGINQGQRVDWNGGQSWQYVLSDALAAYDLQIKIHNNIVHISKKKSEPLSVTPEEKIAPVSDQTLNLEKYENAADLEQNETDYIRHVQNDGLPPTQPHRQNKMALAMKAAPAKPESAEKESHIIPPALPTETAATRQPKTLISTKEITGTTQEEKYPWKAEKGASLRQVLTNWSNIIGAQVLWYAPQDYLLLEDIQVQGSYSNALQEILNSFDDSDNRPVGRLYPNTRKQPAVLVIEQAGH